MSLPPLHHSLPAGWSFRAARGDGFTWLSSTEGLVEHGGDGEEEGREDEGDEDEGEDDGEDEEHEEAFEEEDGDRADDVAPAFQDVAPAFQTVPVAQLPAAATLLPFALALVALIQVAVEGVELFSPCLVAGDLVLQLAFDAGAGAGDGPGSLLQPEVEPEDLVAGLVLVGAGAKAGEAGAALPVRALGKGGGANPGFATACPVMFDPLDKGHDGSPMMVAVSGARAGNPVPRDVSAGDPGHEIGEGRGPGGLAALPADAARPALDVGTGGAAANGCQGGTVLLGLGQPRADVVGEQGPDRLEARLADLDDAFEASGAEQGGIDVLDPVGGADDDDTLASDGAIEFLQKTGDDAGHVGGVAVAPGRPAPERVDLVEEEQAGDMGTGAGEAGAHRLEDLVEVPGPLPLGEAGHDQGDTGFLGDEAGEPGLARPRRAGEDAAVIDVAVADLATPE